MSQLRVLFDIVHPGHVLFFRHPIRRLMHDGHAVQVASRHKDITTDILDQLDIPHNPISTARKGRLGLARELILRDVRLLRIARRFDPDVLVGFGGIAISHVGTLLGIRSVAFYDTEIATLQLRVTLPFISEWHVPECYQGPVPDDNVYRFQGIKPLAYLGPNQFSPDLDRAVEAGLDPERDNFLIRTVAWGAAHDLGKSGFRESDLERLVNLLQEKGKIHLSAEGALPDPFESIRYRGGVLNIHHLLAHCRLYVGESASMAAEAAVLGVPACFVGDFQLSVINKLQSLGLVTHTRSAADARKRVQYLLDVDPRRFRKARAQFLSECEDIAAYVLEVIRANASSRPIHP